MQDKRLGEYKKKKKKKKQKLGERSRMKPKALMVNTSSSLAVLV